MNKEQKLGLSLSKIEHKEVEVLRRALNREKVARKAAELLLESKSKELFDSSMHLREVNGQLEALISGTDTKINGAFVNIVDPYIVMELNSKVISMNNSAKEFLGYDHEEEELFLSNLVHKDYIDYTRESFKSLLHLGVIKNYKAKIFTKKFGEKHININANLIYDSKGQPIAAQGIIRDITREMEIKELLENQTKEQEIIVENSSLGIVLIVEDKIVKANKAFVELLGYSEAELKKVSLEDISRIEDISLYENLLKENQFSDSHKFSDTRLFHKKNGESIWGKTSVNSIKNRKGKEKYKVALIEDITQDKLSEEKLKTSEQRLTTLISNLQTGVLLEDSNRKLVLTNQKFCHLFQIPIEPQKLTGVNCKHALDKYKKLFKNPEKVILRTESILKNKKLVLSDELELQDGRTFERDYIPLFVDDTYQGHLWSYNDVTLKKTYRENLKKQKQKYGSIIANINLGLVEIDRNHNIILANKEYSEMIGQSQQDLIGRNVFEVMNLDSENEDKVLQKIKNREQNLSESYQIEIKIGNKIKHWLISAAPNYDENGKVVGSIGVHLDITEQKELELQKQELLDELEDSNRGLKEYAHIVSHDLKSPLRSVTALATWLYEDYKDALDSNGKYNLKMMMEKVEGMDKLIDGILKYSTVNNDVLDDTDVDVNEVIKDITEIIYIPENVKVKTAGQLPVIRADKVKIHQLFQNFLSNAVVNIEKRKGLVEVGFKETASHWQFSVQDNGVGIPKEYHEKIFQIFQSIGNNERSTGIGLSIVKKIIDRYHGKVWLESEIGVGTTFYFTLKK